jgi:cytoskeletal protein CcmA (bactofilin family)
MIKLKGEKVIVDEIHTVLGLGSRFEGKLFFEGTVRIDGYFSGEIFTKGKLIVGEKGEVKATIEADELEIAGIVEGNIISSGKVFLRSTARVLGDIQTRTLVVEEGASFNGICKMERKLGNFQEDREFIHIS